MAYDTIQPAAFIPTSNAAPYHVEYDTLAFPAAWRAPILDLYKHGMSEQRQAKIRNVPIGKLNATLRAVAPDLVTVDTHASFDEDRPWLYAGTECPQAVMDSFINAWLRDLQPSDEAFPLVRDTAQRMRAHAPRWKRQSVNMFEHTVSPGGTVEPAPHLYRLLPELLADRIAALPPYEHCGERLSFRRVAVDSRADGAELMSWPPLSHETKTKNDGARTWQYSAVIRVSLRTVPFSPLPRIHIKTGIRRWVNGRVWTLPKAGVSTYLLAESSLVPGGLTPSRFAVAKIGWDYKTGKTDWKQGGTEGMLLRVSALDNLPPIDSFVKEPETWCDGRDGVTAAVSHHTMMGRHAIGAGLMPSERRRLVEWAAQALEPKFQPTGELRRSSIKQQNPDRILERNTPVRKDATAPEREETEATNTETDARNADTRRTWVADAIGDRSLTVLALYQSDAVRDHLINAAEHSLGLTARRRETGPSVWSWHTPEFDVRLHARPLDSLGAPLGDKKTLRKTEKSDQAIAQRRTQVARFLDELSDEVSEPASLALVELDGKESFDKRADPKFALRLGCADRGVVTQFLRPRDASVNDEDDDAAFRATAAWADGLRQLGARLVPQHTLGTSIPDQLDQLAFWMVKRRTDHDQMKRPQFTPVAILIRSGQSRIMGKTADMTGWVPYPELLTQLAGKLRSDELATEEQQADAAAAFIKKTVYGQKGRHTLVVTHAQNTRCRWSWLQNSGLVPDKIQIGGGPLQRLAFHGKYLRIARVATSKRAETPQWWAPKNDDQGGLTKGLWAADDADDTNRVFYSTVEKASTHTIGVDATKLTPHVNTSGNPEQVKPRKNAWNPELLEFTMAGLTVEDDAERWAMFLHQQRLSEDYRDSLSLPLILHLAKLTDHYALPHEEEDPIVVNENTDPDEQPEPLEDVEE